MTRLRQLGLIGLVAFAMASCNPSGPPPVGPVPDADMSVTAVNGSDRSLELFVNGDKVADVAAGSERTVQAKDLPPLPWAVQLRSPTGRALLDLPVRSGSVVRFTSGSASGSRSPGARADLSCGRIELWALYPLLGPAPGPGTPGDCDP